MWERDSEGSDVTVGDGFLYGWQLNLEPNYFIVCFEVASVVLVFLLVVVTLVGGSGEVWWSNDGAGGDDGCCNGGSCDLE